MTDKVQKIREEVARIQLYTQSEVLKQVLDYIDEVQKEPVSEELEEAAKEYVIKEGYLAGLHYNSMVRSFKAGAEWHTSHNTKLPDNLLLAARKASIDMKDFDDNYLEEYPYNTIAEQKFIEGANWQKQQDLTPSTELSNFIDKLSKQFPEVSFAKLSRIAVRVAKWQQQQEYTCYEEAFEDGAKWKAEQFEKNRLKHCDSITNEQAELEQGFIDQHIDKYQRMPTFLDAIEYGMRLQKEELMAKAIDGVIAFDYYGNDNKTYGCIAHDSFCLEDFGLKDNDNVKVIVIKED